MVGKMKHGLFWVGLSVSLAGVMTAGCSSSGGGTGSGGSDNAAGAGGSGNAAGLGGAAGAAGVGGAAGAGGSSVTPGEVGAPCTQDGDCTAPGAACLKDSEGWPNGYCTVVDCKAGSCPTGSECFETSSGNTYCLDLCTTSSECAEGYACHPAGACIPACSSATDCDTGEICDTASGLCKDPPCTASSCASGLKCDDASGKCVPDTGNGPPPGPGPDCTGKLPQRDCTGTLAYCGELLSFDPKLGPGYEDYPINGETESNQYRSFLRRDAQMLVKYAAAYVACKAPDWKTGNGGPIGLGDMSEADGSIPGTSIGQPGHPASTHEDGLDIDIGYFQAGTVDNKLRPICEHTSGGKDQYHCVAPPDKLDLWRNTLFLGALMTSELVRVIGVDGQVGPLVEQAMPALCATGWLPQKSCTAVGKKLAYETTDQGYGWFQFHHHHQHLSTTGKAITNPTAVAPELGGPGPQRLAPEQMFAPGSLLALANVPGHGRVSDLPPARLHQRLPGRDRN
jgi:hypothetical protein